MKTTQAAGVVFREVGRIESDRHLASIAAQGGSGSPGSSPGSPESGGSEESTIQLRAGGAWTTIVTHPEAPSSTTDQAVLLVAELARIYGVSGPTIESGTQLSAVRLGLGSEWGFDFGETPWDWAIGTTAGGVAYILGRNTRGLQVAVQRVLHHLGYHRLTTNWEIFPSLIDDIPMPIEFRQLKYRFFNLGVSLPPPGGTARLDAFQLSNCLINDGLWSYGHAWAAIEANKHSQFLLHPEWLAGDGSGTKFCTFEPGLQQVTADYVIAQFAASPTRRCQSVAASDGSEGFTLVCSGTGEQDDWNPSDRSITLANPVQAALSQTGADRHVAIQAYADCSAAPTLLIDPEILVVWATAYMEHGLSAEQVRDSYLSKGAILHAPYSYYSEWLWDFDMPCKSRSARRSELLLEIERLDGATGSAGECMYEFVRSGRFLWSFAGVNVGDDAGSRWDSWPALAFPHAQAEAQAWYDVVDVVVPESSDLVHRMAQAALNLINAIPADQTSEIERALDRSRWVVYVSLYRAYKATPGATTMEALLRWDYRCRSRDIVTYAALFAFPTYSVDRKAVAAAHPILGQSDVTTSNASLFFVDTATTKTEIAGLLATIISTNNLIQGDLVSYDDFDLVCVTGLTHVSTTPGAFAAQVKDQEWWYRATGGDIITFTAGTSRQDLGPSHVRIYEWDSGITIWENDIPEDGVARQTTGVAGQLPLLTTQAQKLYRAAVTNAKTGFVMTWTNGPSIVHTMTDDLAVFSGSYSGFFLVPPSLEGKDLIWFAQSGTIKFFGPDNVQVGANITGANDFVYVPVADGNSGVWRVTGMTNRERPYNAPRQLWRRASENLVPRSLAVELGLPLADAIPPPTPSFPEVVFSDTLGNPSVTLTGTTNGNYQYIGFDGSFYVWGAGQDVIFTIDAGIVSPNKGPSVVTVVDTTTSLTVDVWSSAPDRVVRQFTFHGIENRLYRFDLDANGSFKLDWPVGTPIVVKTTGRDTVHMPFVASYDVWVYVQKGQTHVEGWFDGGNIRVYDDKAKLITTFTSSGGYYSWPVPAGKDGTCMRVKGIVGRCEFTTISKWACLKDPNGLLLPIDVIFTDQL